MLEICRVCCESTQGTNAKNLFESKQSILLYHLELLTGEWLTYEKDTPSCICNCCEQDLKVAATLRERCIKTQKILRYRDIIGIPTDIINEFKLEENLTDDNEHNETDQCDDADDTDDPDYALHIKVSVTDDENFDEENDNLIIASSNIKEEDNQTIEDDNEIEAQPVDRTSPVLLEKPKGKSDCICDQCGRHFSDLGNLKLHILRHTGIKKFECKECNVKFYTAHLLKRHGITHKSKPPLFACKYCGKTFLYNNYRLRHEREHFRERRFHCDYCDKKFFKAYAKKDHELIHIGSRDFHCELCDQHFLRMRHLKAHFLSKTHINKVQKQK